MGDGSLTQEEIDLLLQGADGAGAAPGAAPVAAGGSGASADLSPLEKETVADIIQQALQSGTQGLGLILSRGITLGSPYAEVRSQDDVEKEFGSNYVLFSQQCSGALNGTLALFLPADAASIISAIVMGVESPDDATSTLDSAQIATVKDAVGPMLFSVATQISVKIGSAITPMPVEVSVILPDAAFPLREDSTYLKIQLSFAVEGAVDTKISMLMPLQMAHSLYQLSQNQSQAATAVMTAPGSVEMPAGPQPGQMGVKDVNFPSLPASGAIPAQTNMNLLMDVQMTLTVELGRTKMYIKEILGLGEGSIIELDKLAGEPVDLLVNGKLIAKGEVVVIDENFGVRVTDIVSPIDRLKGQRT